jgi:hypothetical protein
MPRRSRLIDLHASRYNVTGGSDQRVGRLAQRVRARRGPMTGSGVIRRCELGYAIYPLF